MTELDIKRRASELLQKGRLTEAIAEYENLAAQSKKPNAAILNLIGDIYVKQGNHEKGFASFLQASRLYAEEGLYHNGIAVGKKILRLDRDQTEVYGLLGSLYARQGLGMDAVKFLNEYTRRKEEANEFPAALAAFAQACEILSDFPEAQIAYGEMLERVNRREDAAACFENAARSFADRGMNPEAEHWNQRAKTARWEGEPDPDAPADVGDLMSLRSLDDDAPAAREPTGQHPAFRGRSDEPPQLAAEEPEPEPVEEEGNAWTVFDPNANPNLPPPPPLPPRGAAAAPPPEAAAPAAPNEAPAEPTLLEGLTLDLDPAPPAADVPVAEAAGMDDGNAPGLELDLPAGEPAGTEPAPPETDAPEPAADPTGEDAPEESSGSTRPSRVSLSNLPGIIMPPSRRRKKAKAPEEPTLEPVAEDASVAPALEPEAATGEYAGTASTAGLDPSASLEEFFRTESPGDDEQAVVIGDDSELIREGGDVSEVIADFRAATSEILDPDDFQAHYDLGTTYLEMELFDEAAAEFELAARGSDYGLLSQEMLGYCFLRKGQLDLAIAELKKGLAMPNRDEREKLGLLYNLGIACGVLDQESEAIQCFQRILEVDPEFRDTKSRLGRLVQNSA